MTGPEAIAISAVVQAVAWYQRSGWPTRDRDFEVARSVIAQAAPGDPLLPALAAAFGDRTEPGAVHRAVLCRALIHAAELPLHPTSRYG